MTKLDEVCKRLWENRELTFGTPRERETIVVLKATAEGYIGIENNQDYKNYTEYVSKQKTRVGWR